MTITHPLAVGTKVRANYPACPCTGKKFVELMGIIQEVNIRQANTWYLLNNGHRIKSDWVLQVL